MGVIDKDGHPKKPLYDLTSVLDGSRDKALSGGRNHADGISGYGSYGIVQYIVDHSKEFPALSYGGVGELCPHLTTEGDCEYLFGQVGTYLALSAVRKVVTSTSGLL